MTRPDLADPVAPASDRAYFNQLERWIAKEAEGWPPYPMHKSGPDFPATDVPMLPATIAIQLVEKWLAGYVLVNADMLNRAADKAGRRHPDDAGFGSDILAALQKGQTDAD